MKRLLILICVLCSLFAQAQPTLQDTTRLLVFDPVKSWVTNAAAVRAYCIGNGSTTFMGPSGAVKTFSLPNVSSTILTNFNTVTVGQGGTGTGSTLTGILLGGATYSAFTSSTVGQIPRCTGANTFAFGALDLADADAVTGVLPAANGGVSNTTGRATGQTAAVASVATVTVGGADASYEVSVSGLVTTSSGEIITVSVDYTDEGNTARNITFQLIYPAALATAPFMRFSYGAVSYAGIPMHIRCKASTDITIKTTGTFTGCTYNIEGRITKI